MIVIAGFVLGAAWGGLLARRRNGSRLDIAQYATAFGIAFGTIVFGGLGQNVFNPALLGRAFLQAAFPVAITTWPARTADWWALRGDNFALPFMSPSAADAVTGATPLGELNIAFYRDDFSRIGMHPTVEPSALPFDIGVYLIVLGVILMVFEAFGESFNAPYSTPTAEPDDTTAANGRRAS
mgnify:CR=1 FL=1